MDRLEVLRHCPVLEGLSDVGMQVLAAVCRERVYPNAQALQRQGEAPRDRGVIFLAAGRVRCEVRDAGDRVLGLGSLEPGDHLGGLRLFADNPSPLTAVAEGEVAALVLDRTGYERMRRQKPQTALKVLMLLTADFGKRITQQGSLFGEYAIYAAQRTNLAERNSYATFAELGLDVTPTARMMGGGQKGQ